VESVLTNSPEATFWCQIVTKPQKVPSQVSLRELNLGGRIETVPLLSVGRCCGPAPTAQELVSEGQRPGDCGIKNFRRPERGKTRPGAAPLPSKVYSGLLLVAERA
jgi:hypothetical protein